MNRKCFLFLVLCVTACFLMPPVEVSAQKAAKKPKKTAMEKEYDDFMTDYEGDMAGMPGFMPGEVAGGDSAAPVYVAPPANPTGKSVPMESEDGKPAPLLPPKAKTTEAREAKQFSARLKKEKDEAKRLEMILTQQNVYAQEEALKLLLPEVQTALKAYRKVFGEAAKKAVTKQIKERRDQAVLAKVERVKALQKTDFTKDQVVGQMDPVISEMLSIYWVDPQIIVAEGEKVAEAREQLLAKSRCWDASVTMFNLTTTEYPMVTLQPTMAEMLELVEFDLVLASMPISPAGQTTLAMNRELATRIDLQEALCISYTNRLRVLTGREPFLIDVAMCLACRDHSYDMARLGFFSHSSPIPGKKSFGDRAKRFGVSGASSENIFAGISTGKSGAEGWWHSPGHHKNMMNGAKRMGVGRFNKHFTQMTAG